ncbi:MAG: AI-2E family transporter, partial [Haloarculaceae archaeon]
VLGAAYFGWYGLFLGPLLAVLGVQLLKQVLPDLVGGDPFVPERDEGVEIGSDPVLDGERGEPSGEPTGGGAGSGAGTGAGDG